jgi:hypothetical protein
MNFHAPPRASIETLGFRRRADAHQYAIVFVRQDIQQSIRTLTDISYSLIRHVHAANLVAPGVVARLREPVLAAQIPHGHRDISLAWEPDDLPFGKSLLL